VVSDYIQEFGVHGDPLDSLVCREAGDLGGCWAFDWLGGDAASKGQA